jgi:hypothetical protein
MNEKKRDKKNSPISFDFVLMLVFAVCTFFFCLTVVAFVSAQSDDSTAIHLPQINAAELDKYNDSESLDDQNLAWVSLGLDTVREKIKECFSWSLEQDASVGSALSVGVVMTRFGRIIVFDSIETINAPSLFFGPCLNREMGKMSMLELPEEVAVKDPIGSDTQVRIRRELHGFLRGGELFFSDDTREKPNNTGK